MTAVAVCTDLPNTPPWYAARAGGIGGSEIGTLLGYNPFATPLDLWRVKTGLDDGFVSNFATRRGHHLEAFLIGEYEHAHPGTFVETPAEGMPSVFALADGSIVRCSLDGIAHDSDGDHLVEVKTAGHRQAVKWDGGALPDTYTAQVVWQLGVMGLDRAVVVADIAGDFTERVVLADPDLFQRMAGYARAWWDRHVAAGVMPDPDPVRDADELAGLWTPEPGLTVEVDADLASGLRDAKAAHAAAKARLAVAQARVQCAMRTATTAVDPAGDQVATWNPTRPVRRVDVDGLRAAEPDLAEKFTTQSPPGRRFTVTRHTTEGDQG